MNDSDGTALALPLAPVVEIYRDWYPPPVDEHCEIELKEYHSVFPFMRLPLEIRLEIYLCCNITNLSYLAASSPLVLRPEITRQLDYILKHSRVHGKGLGCAPVGYLRSVYMIIAEVMDEKSFGMQGAKAAKRERDRSRRVGYGAIRR